MRKCSSIGGVLQDPKQLLIIRQAPLDRGDTMNPAAPRKRDLLLVIPQQGLPERSHRFKPLKQTPHRFLNLPVRSYLYTTGSATFVADWDHSHDLAPLNFPSICFLRTLPKNTDFKLAHRP